MSAFFGDEANAAEKLLRAGATGRTILAALPTDADGGIEPVLTPDQVIEKRFPPPNKQMPAYIKRPDGTIIEALPADTFDRRFPKPDDMKAVPVDFEKWREYLDKIKKKDEPRSRGRH
jgi:hypothetical protein